MTTLTDFLLARIAEDEAVAHAAQHQDQPTWRADFHSMDAMGPKFSVLGSSGQFRSSDVVDHVVRFQPSRILGECEAKRRIVSRCDMVLRGREHGMFNDGQAVDANDNLRSLAQVYADHPDYQPEWSTND